MWGKQREVQLISPYASLQFQAAGQLSGGLVRLPGPPSARTSATGLNETCSRRVIFQQYEHLNWGTFTITSVEEVAGEEHLVKDTELHNTPVPTCASRSLSVPAFRLGPVPRGCKSAAIPSKEKSCAKRR